MKKFLFTFLSFVFLAVGGCFVAPSLTTQANADETEERIINVGSAQEFVNIFSTQTTYNDENVKVLLNSSLDFEGVDLSPVSASKNTFMGTLDGNGYAVSNLSLTSGTLYFGLIPYAKNATIQNLKVSGKINFTFDDQNVQEVYAGVLVGYGENVVFENCELDNTVTDEEGNTSHHTIDIPVYSNVNFGFLAGKVKGNPNANNQIMPANIVNCVNYYNANVVFEKFSNTRIGGLVGNLENAYVLNSMNFGSITYSKNPTLTSSSTNTQYFGGIAGAINGSGINIRNIIFGGQINSYEDITGMNALVGAIFGSALSTQPNTININFGYYTQNINPSGDNYVQAGTKLALVSTINKALLSTSENFDQSVQTWDFDNVWILVNSQFHIQNFQTFDFSFASIIDRGQVLDVAKAVFTVGGSQSGEKNLKARYGLPITIKIYLKDEYQGFYKFTNVQLNNNNFTGLYEVEDITSSNGIVTGFSISLTSNATTAGTYSFVVSQKTYSCEIAVSDAAKTGDHGGVRVYSSNNDSTAKYELPMTFAINSSTTRILAEGKDIWSFDYWKIYYRDENGDFSGEGTTIDDGDLITISFGTAPFNKEFKLVAFFTDANAIKVGFGKIDNSLIKSITLSGREYVGEEIPVAQTRRIQIEVVTQKDYILDTATFESEVLKLYGDNPSPYPVIEKEAEVNENGETTYFFTIELARAKDNIKNNTLKLTFNAVEDTSNDGDTLLWLWITLPCVGVLAIGLIIFFVVRRRRGGGKGGSKGPKVKEKAKSYKDYYV